MADAASGHAAQSAATQPVDPADPVNEAEQAAVQGNDADPADEYMGDFEEYEEQAPPEGGNAEILAAIAGMQAQIVVLTQAQANANAAGAAQAAGAPATGNGQVNGAAAAESVSLKNAMKHLKKPKEFCGRDDPESPPVQEWFRDACEFMRCARITDDGVQANLVKTWLTGSAKQWVNNHGTPTTTMQALQDVLFEGHQDMDHEREIREDLMQFKQGHKPIDEYNSGFMSMRNQLVSPDVVMAEVEAVHLYFANLQKEVKTTLRLSMAGPGGKWYTKVTDLMAAATRVATALQNAPGRPQPSPHERGAQVPRTAGATGSGRGRGRGYKAHKAQAGPGVANAGVAKQHTGHGGRGNGHGGARGGGRGGARRWTHVPRKVGRAHEGHPVPQVQPVGPLRAQLPQS